MTGAELGDIVNTLLALCPRAAPDFTPALKRAWWLALKPYDYAATMENALRYARQKSYFPRVSDIVPAEESPKDPPRRAAAISDYERMMQYAKEDNASR